MSGLDQGEQIITKILEDQARGVFKATVSYATRFGETLAADVLGALNSTARALAQFGQTESSKVTVKELQRFTGNDSVQVNEVPAKELKAIQAELNKNGVKFATEKGADGRTYLHFIGRDLKSVEHGVNMARSRVEKKIAAKVSRGDLVAEVGKTIATLAANRPVPNLNAIRRGPSMGSR